MAPPRSRAPANTLFEQPEFQETNLEGASIPTDHQHEAESVSGKIISFKFTKNLLFSPKNAF